MSQIKIEGIPLILYDKKGISFSVQGFGRVVARSLQLAPVGSLMAVDASIRVYSAAMVSMVVSFAVGGHFFVVRVRVQAEEGVVANGLWFRG